MAPCHPGEAIIPTGYLSKNNSYGRARMPLRASTVGCPASRAGGGCHARARATRSQDLCPRRVYGTANDLTANDLTATIP